MIQNCIHIINLPGKCRQSHPWKFGCMVSRVDLHPSPWLHAVAAHSQDCPPQTETHKPFGIRLFANSRTLVRAIPYHDSTPYSTQDSRRLSAPPMISPPQSIPLSRRVVLLSVRSPLPLQADSGFLASKWLGLALEMTHSRISQDLARKPPTAYVLSTQTSLEDDLSQPGRFLAFFTTNKPTHKMNTANLPLTHTSTEGGLFPAMLIF